MKPNSFLLPYVPPFINEKTHCFSDLFDREFYVIDRYMSKSERAFIDSINSGSYEPLFGFVLCNMQMKLLVKSLLEDCINVFGSSNMLSCYITDNMLFCVHNGILSRLAREILREKIRDKYFKILDFELYFFIYDPANNGFKDETLGY